MLLSSHRGKVAQEEATRPTREGSGPAPLTALSGCADTQSSRDRREHAVTIADMVPASLCHRLPALHTEIDLARDAAQGRLRDSRAAGQPPSCVSAWRLLLRAGHLLTLPHAAGAVAPATRREAKPQPLTLVQLRLEVLDLVGDGKQPRQRPSTPLQLARHPVRREVRASPLICIA